MHAAPSVIPPANVAGLRWLAGFHPDPIACLDAWDRGDQAEIPLRHLAAVQVSATLGIRAAQRLEPIGPVLHSVSRGTVEFLVAPTTMAVDRPGVRLLTGGALPCPPPGRAPRRRRAPRWMVEPDGLGRLMDVRVVLDAVVAEYAYFATLPDNTDIPVGRAPSATAAAAFITAGRRAAGRP
ncbi:hypothetical protein OG618_37045 (plasmid) [Kitasatospora sp. NBC_01246]|uniref:hypothetical protein n=1 Tax=Kitasatospora sp. NBC_01246 TaxID=2903570 RepID=UPI002E34A0AA|nr:hypothetical protein [Kitasatospora sp. NBC_01246]